MKCIILAAGYATRLYPLTENYPKSLLEFGGKSILDWLVDDIDSLCDEFVLISNHKYYNFFREWSDNKSSKMVVLDDGTSTNENRLGAVRDIEFALNKLAIDDDCIVMAGDNLLDFSLKGFVEYAENIHKSCVMCHKEDDIIALQKTAVITVDSTNRILTYEEKPAVPKGNLAVPPFYYFRNEELNKIHEALDSGCGTDAPGAFAAWLSQRTELFAYVMPGKRYDIGDIKSYENAKIIFDSQNR